MSTSSPPTPHAQSSDDAAPTGWGVAAASASASAAPADSHYSSRVGNRKLRSLPEVQRHLKHDVGEANCNADELLWLQTLERYGTSFAKHWAVAKAVPELEECPTFRPTLEEWSEPGRYVESIMPQITAHGMCKVVPPAGWRPQPWSGRPPKGATDRERSEVVGSVEEVCRALGGRDREGSVTCELNPRVQPMQLFNKSFEQIGAPPARPPHAHRTATPPHAPPRRRSRWCPTATAKEKSAAAPAVVSGVSRTPSWWRRTRDRRAGGARRRIRCLRRSSRAVTRCLRRSRPRPPL